MPTSGSWLIPKKYIVLIPSPSFLTSSEPSPLFEVTLLGTAFMNRKRSQYKCPKLLSILYPT